MSRKTLIITAFAITLILCYLIAGQTAGKTVLPTSIEYINGYPNDNLLYAFMIAAIISFSFGVFTMVKNKLVAAIVTVIGLILISLVTFLAGFFQASIGY